jgi:hypothetical protein
VVVVVMVFAFFTPACFVMAIFPFVWRYVILLWSPLFEFCRSGDRKQCKNNAKEKQ